MADAAERKRQQRERARDTGLCIVCCKARAREGMATCAPCNDGAKARVEASRG